MGYIRPATSVSSQEQVTVCYTERHGLSLKFESSQTKGRGRHGGANRPKRSIPEVIPDCEKGQQVGLNGQDTG